jgi:hypothetical protein
MAGTAVEGDTTRAYDLSMLSGRHGAPMDCQ